MMPIFDYDGTANHEAGKIYDYNGAANTQIGKVYDHDGTANHLIYSAEETVTLTVSTLQGPNAYNREAKFYYPPAGYTTVTVNSFTPGESFGQCETLFYHHKNGVFTHLRHDKAAYNGVNIGHSNVTPPLATFTQPDGLSEFCLCLDAMYNPNLSGQHTSTAAVTFTLS